LVTVQPGSFGFLAVARAKKMKRERERRIILVLGLLLLFLGCLVGDSGLREEKEEGEVEGGTN